MKAEVRSSLIFAAATLSVIAVPLIAALVGHLNAAWVATIIGSVAAAVLAATTLVFWLYSRGVASGSELQVQAHLKALNLQISLERDAIRRLRESELLLAASPLEVQLLNELDAIEREARTALGEGPSTSIIRIRAGLQDSDVWSEEDVYDFDVALRTRNKVAHGDQEGLTKASLAEAIETMKRLRGKLEATQISPPSN